MDDYNRTNAGCLQHHPSLDLFEKIDCGKHKHRQTVSLFLIQSVPLASTFIIPIYLFWPFPTKKDPLYVHIRRLIKVKSLCYQACMRHERKKGRADKKRKRKGKKKRPLIINQSRPASNKQRSHFYPTGTGRSIL
jgi:hypothetical protein